MRYICKHRLEPVMEWKQPGPGPRTWSQENQIPSELASFPGRSRLQFLIASSIKTEGEGLGERVTCVTSGRREGRREGGGARRRISRSFL